MTIGKSHLAKQISQDNVGYEKDLSPVVRFCAASQKNLRDETGDSGTRSCSRRKVQANAHRESSFRTAEHFDKEAMNKMRWLLLSG